MDLDPKIPPYHTSDKTSFAYISAKDRWPVIITSAISDVYRRVSDCQDEAKIREGKAIIENIVRLRHELQHDRKITALPDDGQPDVAGYNEELRALGFPSWFNVPWLFGECYLYRRLSTIFTLTEHWKSYDVFRRQKDSTFRSSRAAVVELADHFIGLMPALDDAANLNSSDATEAAQQALFEEMCEICLWGNATDLSLLTSLTYEDIQKLQGSEARKASKKNIVVDDLAKAYRAIRQNKTAVPRRIDIVLDNAGFELYVDLVLAAYLLTANIATEVVLHPKSIPWFVSDVIPADFASLLNILADPQPFYETPSDEEKSDGRKPTPVTEKEVQSLTWLFETLSNFHAGGSLIIRPNRFWTHAGSYWRLPHVAPGLWQDLKSSWLVIFKGDLNYRKLTGDVMWDPSTPFAEALGPLGKGSGVRILALRTCKADVVVGLPKGKDEELRRAKDGGGDEQRREWAWSGKWAVVQFSDGSDEQV